MSSPSGGSGFQTGADYVAARLSIDVPDEGIASLRELTQQIEKFRTSTEQAARGSESFISYLKQMQQAASAATEAHRNLAAQLDRTLDMQSRTMAGPGGTASSLPLSRIAPEGYSDPGFGTGGAGTGSRSPNQSDISSQVINPAMQRDPATVMNSAAGRSAVRLGGLPSANSDDAALDRHEMRTQARDQAVQRQQDSGPDPLSGGGGAGSPIKNKVGGWSGLAQHFMNETGPGGTNVGTLGMLGHAANKIGGYLGGKAAAAGGTGGQGPGGFMGTLASLAPALLKGGGVIGAAATGLAAFEKGGQMYQGYKNMGLVTGDDIGQGVKDEASIRMMALNPFITTEQARQVIQAGLTEGYGTPGQKTFDTVTDFMANNLKNMNLSISDSVQLLRKNVNEGGQSVDGLTKSLGQLKEIAKGGVSTLPDLEQGFVQTSTALTNAGFGGQQASDAAVGSGQQFSNSQVLKYEGFQQTQEAFSSDQSMAVTRAFGGGNYPSGLLPSMMGLYQKYHGGLSADKQAQNVFKKFALMAAKSPGARQKGSLAYLNAIGYFQYVVRANFPDNKIVSDANAAEEMYCTYVFGSPNGGDSSSPGGGDEGTQSVGGSDSGSAASGPQVPTPGGGGGGASAVADNLVSAAQSGHGLQIDMGGQWTNFNANNQSQVEALRSGNANWRRAGESGAGYSINQTPAQSGPGTGTPSGGGSNVSFSPASVHITIDNKGNATASPNPIQLTPNQVGAITGVGGAQMNNEPPSDIAGYKPGIGMH